MPADAAAATLLADLPGLAFAFALVLGRVGAACILLPPMAEAEVPATVRAGLAMLLVLVLLPVLLPVLPPAPAQPLRVGGMVAAEVGAGLFLGWLARLAMLALPLAGQVIALATGLSSVIQPDPALGAQSAALGRLFGLAAPVLLLASGLYTLPLRALAGSYAVLPVGLPLPAGDSLASVVASVGAMLGLALRLAAPFLLASLGWSAAMGLLGRVAPMLPLSSLSAPLQLLGGLLLLGLLGAALLATWQEHATSLLAALPGL